MKIFASLSEVEKKTRKSYKTQEFRSTMVCRTRFPPYVYYNCRQGVVVYEFVKLLKEHYVNILTINWLHLIENFVAYCTNFELDFIRYYYKIKSRYLSCI